MGYNHPGNMSRIYYYQMGLLSIFMCSPDDIWIGLICLLFQEDNCQRLIPFFAEIRGSLPN